MSVIFVIAFFILSQNPKEIKTSTTVSLITISYGKTFQPRESHPCIKSAKSTKKRVRFFIESLGGSMLGQIYPIAFHAPVFRPQPFISVPFFLSRSGSPMT